MSSASPAPPTEHDIRPVVATGYGGNRSVWLFAGGLAIAAVALFVALDARRQDIAAPATAVPSTGDGTMISAPPELVVPTGSDGGYTWHEDYPAFAVPIAPRARPGFAPPVAAPVVIREPARVIAQSSPTAPPYDVRPVAAQVSAAPSVVYEARMPTQRSEGSASAVSDSAADAGRVRAGRLTNPSTTVPQGTVIPAVLETALDSTRAGAVRAIVSRDVRGFDGTRTLVPRGSRLYGEYNAELAAGQNRALIRWQRLVRPDGALIALDSPASDPLGRAGVKGKVDSHFLERFGSAILQSALDIGVGLATRKVDDTIVVALPGSTQNVTGANSAQQVQRTLRVRQGTSVSVFVARDLDFSPVE